jgi:hypothetical protein
LGERWWDKGWVRWKGSCVVVLHVILEDWLSLRPHVGYMMWAGLETRQRSYPSMAPELLPTAPVHLSAESIASWVVLWHDTIQDLHLVVLSVYLPEKLSTHLIERNLTYGITLVRYYPAGPKGSCLA